MKITINLVAKMKLQSLPFRKVTKFIPLFYLVIFLVPIVGCTAVYIAGGQNSPDSKYEIHGHIRGAYGHSFLDETKKTVYMDIMRINSMAFIDDAKTNLLLEKEYHLLGSGIGWDATWDTNDNVVVTFFDYGPGVYWEDAKKKNIPKRYISTINYRLDSKTGKFTEEPNN